MGVQGLGDIYPYTFGKKPFPPSRGSVLDSGLLLLSKYPISSSAFHRFGNTSGIDGLSDKGVMLAHIDLHDDSGIVVANTHFQAGGPDEVRHAQSIELVDALGRFVESLENTTDISRIPIFAAGDFNTRELDDEYGTTKDGNYLRLLETLGAADLFRQANGEEAPALTTRSRRLDYVFGLSGNYTLVGAGIDDFADTAAMRLSDHLGTYAIVDVPSVSQPSTNYGARKQTPGVGTEEKPSEETMDSGTGYLSCSFLFFVLVTGTTSVLATVVL